MNAGEEINKFPLKLSSCVEKMVILSVQRAGAQMSYSFLSLSKISVIVRLQILVRQIKPSRDKETLRMHVHWDKIKRLDLTEVE